MLSMNKSVKTSNDNVSGSRSRRSSTRRGYISRSDESKLRAARKSTSMRITIRARVVLLWNKGESTSAIARTLGISRQTAGKWIERFKESGTEGLLDQQRSGRPQVYREDCIQTILDVARTPPRLLGLPFQTWSVRKLEHYLNVDRGHTIKRSRIWQVLNHEKVKRRVQKEKRRPKI